MEEHRLGASARMDEDRRAFCRTCEVECDDQATPVGEVESVASYIADMVAQLEAMASAARLDLLAYFLAMARAESEAAARANAG